MISHVYRFRSTRALLQDFHELERHEIYFAHPSELNDPLDGLKDVYWRGDAILWSNLLNHYILCLMHAAMMALLDRDNTSLLDGSFVFSTEDALPTELAKDLFREIKLRFFQDEGLAQLPTALGLRPSPVRRIELRMYLRMLHMHAVDSVLGAMEKRSLMPVRAENAFFREAVKVAASCRRVVNIINDEERSKPGVPFPAETFGEATESIHVQLGIMRALERPPSLNGPVWQAIISDFPHRYVTDLEKLLYNEWYTACFVEEPTNAAMWGNYGDGHNGVALKFKSEVNASGLPCIKLNQIIGERCGKGIPSVPIRDFRALELHRVVYNDQFVAIDFFRSMGQVTGAMLNFWGRDGTGNYSPLIKDIVKPSEEWRRTHFENLLAAITTKLKDWSHEKERRLVLRSSLIDLRTKEARKLIYDFADLEGIVFGMKTPAQAKLEIIRTVREKCRQSGRKTFEFFQADFSRLKGAMHIAPLHAITVT